MKRTKRHFNFVSIIRIYQTSNEINSQIRAHLRPVR